MRASTNDTDRWQRVERILDQLFDSSEQGAAPALSDRLDELCDGDLELRAEVAELLELGENRDDLLDGSIADVAADLVAELAAEPEQHPSRSPGRRIDRYRLLEVLGRGGMGVVYKAERADREFHKQVALKVIPRGLETPEKERRFRIERQILARLDHENVARLLDGGVTNEGYPYLVMELVEGEAIDRYCEARNLDRTLRLKLFLKVCSAVHYAHQNLVIHRDLKPGNIFVSSSGVVKLLDFGVGKILDDRDQESASENGQSAIDSATIAAAQDLTRNQPMTPRFASPEQRANRPVSTASDIYSLGLVLHHLLTGSTPVVDTAGLEPGLALTGDLEIIVARALRDAPAERFSSARELADDITRYLAGLPIESRPSTWSYRLGKLVFRHRAASVSLAVASLLLLGLVAAIAWQGHVAALERDRAQAEALKAERMAGLLKGLFEAASPYSGAESQLTVRELLDRGESRMIAELGDQPTLRGEMLAVLGSAHAGLGDGERSQQLIEASIRDLRRSNPVDEVLLARSLTLLAGTLGFLGKRDAIEGLLEEALDLLRGQGAIESVDAAQVYRGLGRWHSISGRHEAAEQHYRTALRLWENHDQVTAAAIEKMNLAGALGDLDRVDEAVDLKREVLTTLIEVHGESHPDVAATRNNLAASLHNLGDYSEAEVLYRSALATGEQTLGTEHPGLSSSLSNLGRVLMDMGRFEDAEPFLRRAVALQRGSVEADAFNRIAIEMNLASLEIALGDLGAGIASYRDGLERFERLTGPESRPSARVRSLLGIALHRRGDLSDAEDLLRQTLRIQRSGAVPIQLADTLVGLGAVVSDRGQTDEAIALLREGLALRLEILPDDQWLVAEARAELAGALLRSPTKSPGGIEEAARLLSESDESLRSLSAESSGPGWIRARAEGFRRLL